MGRQRIMAIFGVIALMAVGAVIKPVRADATTLPQLTINDVSFPEGDLGSVTIRVPVLLSAPSATTVKVKWALTSSDASSSDYLVNAGSLSFAKGAIEKWVPVTVFGDTAIESDEHIHVNITSVTNATWDGTPGVVTIQDDDANGVSTKPEVNVGDVTTTQGLLGTQTVYVPITLSRPAGVALKISVATQCGNATDDTFAMRTLNVTIPKGKQVVFVALSVYSSTSPEPDVTFTVQAHITSAIFTPDDMSGAVTVDGSADPTPPSNNLPLGISRVSEPEGGGEPVSLTSKCGQATGNEPLGAISRNGKVAVFSSGAVNLLPSDMNGQQDVFARDLVTGDLERASVASDGGDPNGWSFWPSVSADGRYVMYESTATNIVSDGYHTSYTGYVYDRVTHTNARLGTGDPSVYGVALSASMSDDDRYIAFESETTQWANAIYVEDLATGTTTRVADGWHPTISGDGNTIVYLSLVTNDVKALDLATGTTELVSIDPTGTPFPDNSVYQIDPLTLTPDGRDVVFTAALIQGHQEVWLRDRSTGTTELESVTPGGDPAAYAGRGSISDDGRYVAFESGDEAFNTDWSPASAGESSASHVYERDRDADATIHVDATPDSDRPDADAEFATVTADGRYVAFTSSSDDLIPVDNNMSPDFFVDRIW